MDDTNLGKYRFVVTDPATGQVLYSRGSSRLRRVGDDRRGGGEDAGVRRALRFRPAGEVRVAIEKRDAANAFREPWRPPSTPPIRSSTAPPAAGRRADRPLRVGAAAGEGRPPPARRRLPRGRTGQVRGRRPPAHRRALRGRAVPLPPRRLQRARSARRRGERHLPPSLGIHRRSPPAPPTPPSAPSGTCSASTTAPGATSPRRRRTTSW